MNTREKRSAFRCELVNKGSVTIFRKVKRRVRKFQVSVSDSSSTGFGIEYSGLDIQPDEFLILKHDQDEFTCEVRHVEELKNGLYHAGLRILEEYSTAPGRKNRGNSVPRDSTARISPVVLFILVLVLVGGIGFWMLKTKRFEKSDNQQKNKITLRMKDLWR